MLSFPYAFNTVVNEPLYHGMSYCIPLFKKDKYKHERNELNLFSKHASTRSGFPSTTYNNNSTKQIKDHTYMYTHLHTRMSSKEIVQKGLSY